MTRMSALQCPGVDITVLELKIGEGNFLLLTQSFLKVSGAAHTIAGLLHPLPWRTTGHTSCPCWTKPINDREGCE